MGLEHSGGYLPGLKPCPTPVTGAEIWGRFGRRASSGASSGTSGGGNAREREVVGRAEECVYDESGVPHPP